MKNTKKQKKKRKITVFREYFELIAEVLVYVFFIMTFLLQSEVIPTGSMENNLLIGDHLLLNKVAYLNHITPISKLLFPPVNVKRGSIVAFKAPPEMEKQYVKRVIGLPGEKIKIIEGTVYINGSVIEEPWIVNNSIFKEDNNSIYFTEYSNYSERTVPKGHYFVMGDNRNNSFDSRGWGFLSKDLLIGKPWRIYWSFKSTTDEYLTKGVKHKIKDIFLTIKNFLSRTRYNRTLKKLR
jgi:signal peptidase I